MSAIEIHQVANIEPNYRFIVAKDEIIARMYLEQNQCIQTTSNIDVIVGILKNGGEMVKNIIETVRLYEGKLLEQCRVYAYHNKIPSVLRNEFAKVISWETVAPTFAANYIALGNGTTAPADNDTTLENELIRWTFQSRSAVGHTAYLDKYFGSTEVSGLTILEVGTFVDATATANSGYLLSRVATNIVVWSNESLTVNVAISLTSAT